MPSTVASLPLAFLGTGKNNNNNLRFFLKGAIHTIFLQTCVSALETMRKHPYSRIESAVKFREANSAGRLSMNNQQFYVLSDAAYNRM